MRSCELEIMAEVIYLYYNQWGETIRFIKNSIVKREFERTALYHGTISQIGYEYNLKRFRNYFKENKDENIFKNGFNHLCTADYFTEESFEILKNKGPNAKINDKTILRYEHIVPKKEYIFKPIESKAKKGELTKSFIYDLLDRYYFVACVTVDQDERLKGKLTSKMTLEWNLKDPFDRYNKVGIKLIENPILKLDID